MNSNGNIFYAVFADTDGDSPEEIGEASWLMARTCFPTEDLNGNSGHSKADVTCEYLVELYFLERLTDKYCYRYRFHRR